MKTIIICLLPLFALAQSDTTKENKKDLPLYVQACTDIMTDKQYAFSSKHLICTDGGKKGFAVKIDWKITNNKISYDGLTVAHTGIGNCSENDQLIFLFEDGTKFSSKSWHEFDCDGKSYFDLGRNKFNEFNSKKVKAIRFQNGRSFESFTYEVPENLRSYFIEAKTALDNQKIVKVSCDE